MGIDLLGQQEEKKSAPKQARPFKWHQPEKEEYQEKKTKKLKESKIKEGPQEVNLASRFQGGFFKKGLIILLVFVIIISGASVGYFFLIYQPTIENEGQANGNINAIVIPEPEPATNGEPEPGPATNGEPEPEPIRPLPDTELKPLKGALIRFAEQEDVYLVEDNGELRLVDKDTVIFKNGLNIFQISPRRIYTINQRFENIRKGREVVGQVDWDPRVLSSQDLKNFLP